MPNVPRTTALIPAPPHFSFPNLVPPAPIVPSDFQLWPEVRSGQVVVSLELAGLDLRAITLPVTPTIPPTVASGDLITAAHENSVRQALQDLWIDVQALAAAAHNEGTWSTDVDAAGHHLTNVGTLSANHVSANSGSFAASMTAQTITASGAAQVGSLTSNGPVNGAEAHITGAVTAASVTASGAVSAGSFSAPVVAASSYVQSSLILSVPDLVFAVGPSTPERMRITAAGNIGIGTANPQHKLQVLSSLGVGSFSGAVAENNVIAINAAGAANYARLAFGTATDLGMGTLFTGMETRTDIGSLDFHVNSSSTAMRITQAGNVGIGTADPWGVLHVNGSCRITLDANGLASNAGLAQFQIAGQSDTTKTLWFGYDTSANVGVIQAGISGIGWSPLLLNPAGGNVGIGTANPQAKLHFFNPSALAANEIGNMIRLDRATPSNTGAAIWNAHDGATDYLAIGAGTGFNPSNNPLLLLKAAGGVAGGTILMFLGGSLKTLSVDGNGFVKAA